MTTTIDVEMTERTDTSESAQSVLRDTDGQGVPRLMRIDDRLPRAGRMTMLSLLVMLP